ncbi:MAG: peptide chain release factor N(5)-glutamine methyltransferase [Blastocatellia bacterium]|nr:peptide chain release factor N(5)-glutamine methyltransferase [Blastocatellia bacterium]MCX7753401.1 peptide chain release factor N(5)-glutamine methyltransferase [Blastocatellia bacterium]MDW8168060.1 peptide chain release factor N(5)-glutamine methyltransferase [Acidobacteriota bacterium]MDW8257691.1 peptide chain release factor N(5)-glutamine methyltransferase [Acidobacteriota bacterium]
MRSVGTIRQALEWARRRLEEANVEDPRRTAGTLLAHALQRDYLYVLTRPEEPLSESVWEEFTRLIERRAQGEPLQYITGHQEFFGLDFLVTPDVLIPRPETELIVEAVLERASDSARLLIIDVGTGSGCLAVTLAVHLPHARILALDISEAALAVARRNAERHSVHARIEFLVSDLFSALDASAQPPKADFIVANPPYISEAEWPSLPREVRDYEPRLALIAGAEAARLQRRLFAEGQRFLKPGGYLVCEMGYGQYPSLREALEPTAWELVEVKRDLQGIERTLVLRRRA